jgi:hypothetical protein
VAVAVAVAVKLYPLETDNGCVEIFWGKKILVALSLLFGKICPIID